MSIDVLSKLFGSKARVKILRLFLLNPEEGFESKDVATRTKVSAQSVRRELSMLEKIGLAKKKTFYKEVPVKSRSKKKKKETTFKKKKVKGWFLDHNFEYLKPLQTLLVDTDTYTGRELKRRLQPAGKVKVLVASGFFVRDDEGRLDLLIAGDKLNRKALEESIRTLEAEIGRELMYAIFDTNELSYRLEMYDKLVCDVLDYPHECIIDSGGIIKGYTS